MKSFFSYYGGKWRAAKLYEKPAERVVVEPFAGAAGYSTYWGAEVVRLYDLDEAICGVWEYLIRVKSSEILGLPDMSVGQSTDDFDLCQEARWLMGFWCNPASAQPKKTLGKWAQAKWGAMVKQRIASQVDSIRRWRIRQCSFADVPDWQATWFIDPPYQGAGKHYRHRNVDYAALAEFCRTREGQTIVCENAGADWLPFETFADVKSGGGSKGGHGISKEVIWTGTV